MSFRIALMAFAVAALLCVTNTTAQSKDLQLVAGTLRSVGIDLTIDVDGQIVQAEPKTPIRDRSGTEHSWRDVEQSVGKPIQIAVEPATPYPKAKAILLGAPIEGF